jgi:hypothetical protein
MAAPVIMSPNAAKTQPIAKPRFVLFASRLFARFSTYVTQSVRGWFVAYHHLAVWQQVTMSQTPRRFRYGSYRCLARADYGGCSGAGLLCGQPLLYGKY